jgi:phage terminase large subunit
MADGQIEVVIPYAPRPQFLPFHDRTQRFACIVAHRRFGKTVGCINDLQRGALLCERERPRFAYVAPYLKQAKAVAWDYALHYSSPIPGVSPHHSELRIDYPNGGQVRLWGADNANAMRGIYLDGVVLDEPADMDPRFWPEVIRPALADRLGWAAFIGTPKGHNGFFDVREIARSSPDWFYLELRASETKILPQSELDAARALMTEDQYAQEFECSFEAAIQGAYYGKAMVQADADKRISRVPYDPRLSVYTAWDLGIGDSTVIWFAQQVGQEVRLIDYYESSGVGLDHYAGVLRTKYPNYAEHLLPHDAEVKELGTGRSRLETLRSLGLTNIRVLPAQSVEDGINAARLLIPRCWFDVEKCARGIECLRQYRAEFDEKLKTLKSRPLHDWTSHGADAFRYLAMGLKPAVKKSTVKYRPKFVV